MEVFDEERDFAERMVRIHVRWADPDANFDEKAAMLEHRNKRLVYMLLLNVAVVVVYAVLYIQGLLPISKFAFFLVAGAAAFSVMIVVYQRNQIGRAIEYFKNH